MKIIQRIPFRTEIHNDDFGFKNGRTWINGHGLRTLLKVFFKNLKINKFIKNLKIKKILKNFKICKLKKNKINKINKISTKKMPIAHFFNCLN